MTKTQDVSIRMVRVEDANATYSIAKEGIEDGKGISVVEEFNKDITKEEEWIRTYLENPSKGMIFVVDHQGEVGGFINCDIGNKFKTKHTASFGVSVRREYRGKGLGTTLILHLLKWCQSNHIEKLSLEVIGENTGAIRLYKNLGFKVEGTLTNQLKNNDSYSDLILMSILLDKESVM